jgi:hypothetical protein
MTDGESLVGVATAQRTMCVSSKTLTPMQPTHR